MRCRTRTRNRRPGAWCGRELCPKSHHTARRKLPPTNLRRILLLSAPHGSVLLCLQGVQAPQSQLRLYIRIECAPSSGLETAFGDAGSVYVLPRLSHGHQFQLDEWRSHACLLAYRAYSSNDSDVDLPAADILSQESKVVSRKLVAYVSSLITLDQARLASSNGNKKS